MGDAPIIGAGCYVDQDVGGAGSTGHSEEMKPCVAALKRIERNFDNDRNHLRAISIDAYVLRRDGEYAGTTLWSSERPDGTWVRVRDE